MEIRLAENSDWDRIWEIFHAVISTGDTLAQDPGTTKDEAHAYWMGAGTRTYVVLVNGRIEGSYLLRPNQPGLGSHVANAGYIVDPAARGHGLGRKLCEHSLREAKRLGFVGMQFNFVISTNERAVGLWRAMGFSIVGTLPKAYRHARLGFVDAYVMHRFLEDV